MQCGDLAVHIGVQRAEGVVGRPGETCGDGRTQPSHEFDDLVDPVSGGGQFLGQHRGIRLALEQAQLEVERDALLLDASEESRKLTARPVIAGREINRGLPAVERFCESYTKEEDLSLRTATETGSSSQCSAGQSAIAAKPSVHRSRDEHDRGDRDDDEDQEGDEDAEEDLHDYHPP